jgi:hypothetical protein
MDTIFSMQKIQQNTTKQPNPALRTFFFAEAGQHAGLISGKRDVLTEPVNLAQHNPTSRRANTLINLTPTYANPPIIPFLQLAIDVTITPPFPITDGDDPSTYAASSTSPGV